VSGLEIVTVNSTNNSNDKADVVASCPTGKTLVGGGADTSSGSAWVMSSRPGTPTGTPLRSTSWVADAQEEGNGTMSNWTLSVYAICATAN
jgi:hypothetical protein